MSVCLYSADACACVEARKRAGGSRASSFPLSTHTQATEATPIVIGHWLRQRHPQRWPTLKVSLLSFYFPFYIFLFFFSYFAFNTLPWLLGFLFNLFFSPSFLFFFFLFLSSLPSSISPFFFLFSFVYLRESEGAAKEKK